MEMGKETRGQLSRRRSLGLESLRSRTLRSEPKVPISCRARGAVNLARTQIKFLARPRAAGTEGVVVRRGSTCDFTNSDATNGPETRSDSINRTAWSRDAYLPRHYGRHNGGE